ncbi:MAG: hypothetical protein ABJE10_08030 [bacterium]
MRTSLLLGATTVLALTAACGGKNTYTLYRNGVASDTLRIHVATFDADEEAEYNRDNCEQARELFQLHPAALSRFWCEKGTFRKKARK